MNRSAQGAARRRRNLLALRVAAFVAAIALGVIGIWMIVTANSTKGVRVGAIASFWALLFAAFAVLGSRVPGRDPDRAAESAEPSPRQFAPPPPPRPGELDLRHPGDIERAAVAAARREFQAELQDMLRREVAAAVSREMAGMRSDVAALRNELVEQVGGQLRLERVETTRLIGSDLEALQHEVRQLRRTAGLDRLEGDPTRSMRITHTLPPPPASPEADVHDAEIVVERVHPPAEPEPVGPEPVDPEADTAPPAGPEVESEPPAGPEVESEPPAGPEVESEPPAGPEPLDTERPAEPVADSATEPLPDATDAPVPPPSEAAAGAPPAGPEGAPQPAPWPDTVPAPADADNAVDNAAPDDDSAAAEPADEPAGEPAETPLAEPPAPAPESAATSGRSDDPLAGLPRLTPFTEFALDPISPAPPAEADQPEAEADADDDDGPGRRHRADDSGRDVLARILARERGR